MNLPRTGFRDYLSRTYFLLGGTHSLMNCQGGNKQEQVCSSMDQVSAPYAVGFQHQDATRKTQGEGVDHENWYRGSRQVSHSQEMHGRKGHGSNHNRSSNPNQWDHFLHKKPTNP